MPQRLVLAAPFLCVSLAALSSYGCDDGNATSAAPSIVRTQTAQSEARFVSRLESVPREITAVAVPAAFCPFVSPFLAPVSVVIGANGGTDMFLRDMQLQFFDIAGVRGGSRSINSSELTTLFGSTLIPGFGTRTFPVSLPFGCVGGQTGTLFIRVVAVDTSGRQDVGSVSVNVR
jgi:hypothetical protein